MSPWSRAEPGDETIDRALFARRARAQEAQERSDVPSLADVMRAVSKSREVREARQARNRALVGMALAAACVAASITGMRQSQGPGGREGIVADVEAPSAKAASGTNLSGVMSVANMTSAKYDPTWAPPAPPAEECEQEAQTNASREQAVAMSTVPPACYAPPTDFTASATTYESSPSPLCASESSCTTANP